jgi:hypothetical protein
MGADVEKEVPTEDVVEDQVDDTTPDDSTTDDPSAVGEQDENLDQPRTYTQDEVEAIVKKRVATFNKKIDKSKSYQQALEKMSQITGLDIPNLLSRLETLSDAEQAKILGLTPDQATQRRKQAEQARESSNTTQKLQRDLEEKTLLLDPQFKDMPLFRDEIYDLLDDNPKLTLKQAYTLVKGDVGVQAKVRDAEQRAVAKMTKSSNQQVVKPGSVVKSTGPKLDAITVSAAQKVGMDPAEYAAFSNMSTLEDFENYRKSQKK